MYEHLKALLLDKQTFGTALVGYSMEVLGQQANAVVQKSVLRFEAALSKLCEMIRSNKAIPFDSLASAIGVKQISMGERERVILVFMSPEGEETLVVEKEKAKLLRAAFNVIHSKDRMKEAFFEEMQKFGMKNIALENSCIWAFFGSNYWTQLCVDIASILDHSSFAKELNVQQEAESGK